MKNNVNNWKLVLFAILVSIFSGCGEMLDDPTIDKKTGEDINFLIVDFNFFTTRINYKIVDVEDNSLVTLPAKIWFTGANANDVVNFAGEKNNNYTTSQGAMELTFDPNVTVSASSPLEITVHVEVDGYQDFSQGIQINSEGKKTFELLLTKDSSGNDDVLTGTEDDDSFVFSILGLMKSAAVEQSYAISYKITKSDVLKFKDYYGQLIFSSEAEMMEAYNNDPEHFLLLTVKKYNQHPLTIDRLLFDGTSQMVSFQKLETGTILDLSLASRKVTNLNGGVITQSATYTGEPQPDVFGFAAFNTDAWEILGTTINHSTLNSKYTLSSASLEVLCATGASIKFASNAVSSFSIDADFYDANQDLIITKNFKGDFPETFVLENVPAKSATAVFRTNNPSFKTIPSLEIATLCSGTYEVDVEAADGHEEYQIALKALCSDNKSVAVAPTYSGEIRIVNSGDPWQGVDMKGGIVNLLAKPDQEYEMRLLWNDEYETTTFSTKFDSNGNYINSTGLDITTEVMDDGRTRIKVEHVFKQSICDDMGW
jgi:hypothetical protein